MTFNELLALVSSKIRNSKFEIRNSLRICIDSRLVKAGDIFVAIEGTVYDGHDFIDQAVSNGAKYIVCQKYETSPVKNPNGKVSNGTSHEPRATSHEVIIIEDSSKAAGALVQASRGNPASQLTNLAVTGTNGKTTVAYLVRSVIQSAGEKCGLISTIIYDTGAQCYQANLTTPDCLTIAEMTKQMLKAGSKYMVIEASSHALSQNRLAGINFKAAAFTNLAGDHMDYHKTKAEYLSAKTKLFQKLLPDATAVLNKQSPEAQKIAAETDSKILWYAVDEPADLTAHIESMDITGTAFVLEYSGQSSIVNRQSPIVKTLLPGRYNVCNSLAAAGLCLAAGFDLQTTAKGLSSLKVIPGRLERIDVSSDESRAPLETRTEKSLTGRATSHVFIDYAHTDDALKNVLSTLKPLCNGKLTVVFGCGGDRDRTKRPRMARVAEQLADFCIVTSDNPRTEKPEAIIDEIVAGFASRFSISTSIEHRASSIEIVIEPDRKKAIELAVKNAAKNDIVLIAGKGHETYQIIGNQKFDFSDKKAAEEYLRKWK